MGVVEILLIAIGLAMDAFAVSVGKGIAVAQVRPRHALSAGLWFGGFQALMPIIGYFLGFSFADVVGSIDHWIAFALLLFIGLKMIYDTLRGEAEEGNNDFSARKMFVMAVATSIDALAVGISLAFVGANIWVAAAVIGVVTALLSASGIYVGRIFGSKLGSRAGFVGGVVLVAIGIKILVEHLQL